MASRAKIRVGILGAARVAPRALIEPARRRTDVEVACIAARDPSRARSFATGHGIAAVAESYGDLIRRDDIDLVYVALPVSGHAEWTIRALEAGKAVLCEKPFAATAGEARRMADAATAAGRPLLEAFHYRFHAAVLRALTLVAEGAVGHVTHVEARFEVTVPYSAAEVRWSADQGGGALMDLGCYAMHVLRTVVGAEPAVTGAFAEFAHGVDARTEAVLAFPGGVTGAIGCSMVAAAYAAPLTVTGDKGVLRLDDFVLPHRGGRLWLERGGTTEEQPWSGPGTYDAQLAHVVEVLTNRAAPLTGGEDAVANITALEHARGMADRQHR